MDEISDETLLRCAEAIATFVGRQRWSDESRAQLSAYRKGRRESEAKKRKISETMKIRRAENPWSTRSRKDKGLKR